jgi:hypothetical protein
MYSLIFMYYNYIETRVCKCFLGASPHRCSYALRAVCRGCSMFQSLEAARDFDFRTYSHIFSNIFPIFFQYFFFWILYVCVLFEILQACKAAWCCNPLSSCFLCSRHVPRILVQDPTGPQTLQGICIQHAFNIHKSVSWCKVSVNE